MAITDHYSIMSPSDSPTTQHWEGSPAPVKENMVGKTGTLSIPNEHGLCFWF